MIRLASGALLMAVSLLASGCATAHLDRARSDLFSGTPSAAIANFPDLPGDQDLNALLFRLERASIRQTNGDHPGAVADFLACAGLVEKYDYYSLSQGAASLALTDLARTYKGMPYERVLLHTLAAHSYLAMGNVSDAGVEARNIVARLSRDLDGYPDDAYSRYLAAACLEATGDGDGAVIEYRAVSRLLDGVAIDERTGRFTGVSTNGTAAVPATAPVSIHEMVCLIAIGSLGPAAADRPDRAYAPARPGFARWGPAPPDVEVHVNGALAGRAVLLTDVSRLYRETQRREAAMKVAKTATRVAIKEIAATQVSKRNEGLGLLLWLALFALEQEDLRRWETLPLWLVAARVPAPPACREVRLIFRQNGALVHEQALPAPPARAGRLHLLATRVL
jgi:hypothetical protein